VKGKKTVVFLFVNTFYFTLKNNPNILTCSGCSFVRLWLNFYHAEGTDEGHLPNFCVILLCTCTHTTFPCIF
jgi:hypothetical protein